MINTKYPKVVIVMPAYNASKTIKDTYKEIPAQLRKNLILVDDNSSDDTAEDAKKSFKTIINRN